MRKNLSDIFYIAICSRLEADSSLFESSFFFFLSDYRKSLKNRGNSHSTRSVKSQLLQSLCCSATSQIKKYSSSLNWDPGDTSQVARCSKGIAVVIQWRIYGTTISCFQPDGFVLSHAIKNAQRQSLHLQKGPNSAKDETYSKILTFMDDTAVLVRHNDSETTITLL